MNHPDTRAYRFILPVLMTCAALAGCGGGGSSSGAATAGGVVNTPGSVGKDLAQGTVTGFGSVYLGGEKYDTDGAEFFDDDQPASQDDLAVGMKVRLAGDFDDGRQIADIVSYHEDLKGPVDEVNGDTLIVMGQTVLVRPDTVLDDGLNIADLQPGDILEVSGYRGAGDIIEATYLELKAPDDVDEFEVIGVVRDLDGVLSEFTIGALRVNYAAADLDDIDQLVEGLLVEVEDSALTYVPGSFTLQATEVEAEAPAGPRELDDDQRIGGNIEIEGLIAEIVDGDTFRLDGVAVDYGADTVFLYGDAAALAVGVKVEVKGQLANEGSVHAARIKFARNSARVSAPVEMVDLDAGSLVVFGITIVLEGQTELEDDRDGRSPFTLADLMAGDFVEVEGFFANGLLVATELEREDAGDDTEIRGVVENIDAAAGMLDILGVTVSTGPGTEYEVDDDVTQSAGAFFAMLASGQTLVEAKWRGPVSDPTVPVDELELEDDDFELDDDGDDDNDEVGHD